MLCGKNCIISNKVVQAILAAWKENKNICVVSSEAIDKRAAEAIEHCILQTLTKYNLVNTNQGKKKHTLDWSQRKIITFGHWNLQELTKNLLNNINITYYDN